MLQLQLKTVNEIDFQILNKNWLLMIIIMNIIIGTRREFNTKTNRNECF